MKYPQTHYYTVLLPLSANFGYHETKSQEGEATASCCHPKCPVKDTTTFHEKRISFFCIKMLLEGAGKDTNCYQDK